MAADKDSESIVFAQVDANLDSNPKIRKAGALGRAVFEFLLRRNALRGFKGSVPIAFVDPDYLADILMITASEAVTAVTKAVTANLIAVDDSIGMVSIVGWHESWGKRAKEGKERTREWRDRKKAESQHPATTCDDGDETPSQVTDGDKSDAKRREEKRDLDQNSHSRVRERHPDAGAIARKAWSHGSKVRQELAAANVLVPPWALLVGTEHAGWTALLDRVCERLVGSTPEAVERICINRIDVAAAKARKDGDGNWFVAATMFSRSSFDTFAELDPKGFERKPAQKPAPKARAGAIGAATPRHDHGTESRPAREVL
ncbi:MAG TPA: hypothetical protein VIV58_38160 [Kofleriaceae bacterium]